MRGLITHEESQAVMTPPKGLTFVQFFPYFWDDNPLPDGAAESLLQGYFISIIRDGVHSGDCTKQSHSCIICQLEMALSQYRLYCLDYDKFIETR